MVLRREHRGDRPAVGEGHQRDFHSAQALLDDHFIPRRAKCAPDHDHLQRGQRFGFRLRQDYAFACSQARCLDDHRVSHLVEIMHRFGVIFE